MTRLEALKGYISRHPEVLEDCQSGSSEDFAKLRRLIPELSDLPDTWVEFIWSDCSSALWAASFIGVPERATTERAYLMSEDIYQLGQAIYYPTDLSR